MSRVIVKCVFYDDDNKEWRCRKGWLNKVLVYPTHYRNSIAGIGIGTALLAL